ncbi:MAG: N-6 DNA methylase [Verrucomicrobia bacterium]|nr:N-6 DNA methylase [Verrucomicrobiota bacterium]
MDNASLQNLLKRLCKVMWEANVTNPITYVTQISYLIFLKMLEEMDAEHAENPKNGGNKRQSIFTKVKISGDWVDFGKLRWSVLTSDPDNARMLETLRTLLPKLALHPALSPAARALFEDSSVVIPDGATLRKAVDSLKDVHLLSEDADVKGDLFEILVNDLGSQKKAAQFRTPRHLIRVIVEMVAPKIGETVCDSAGGTGGFAIAAFEHILLANTSPEFVREVVAPYGLPVKRGIGDRLKPSQWKFLQEGTLHIFEADKDIIRMAAMNAVLQGFDRSPIVRRDSICGSEDKWDEVQFDVILENPPFSGQRGDAKRSLRIEKGDKYVLFLAHALRSLRPGGRAAIVFPNGILFGDSNSHTEVKKRLLAECDLQAVVTLPKGMFEPYTPNPTCFLVFQKTGRPTKETWFYRVQGDGSSLKKARKFGPQFPNDFPDLLKKWPKRQTADGVAWRVPAEKIIANGYKMSPVSLGLVEPEKTDHAEPEEILSSVSERERKIMRIAEEMHATVNLAFSERGDGWDTDTVEALCGKPQYGYTESAAASPIGPRFLRITDIQAGKVNWETVPYCRCNEVQKYRLSDGDILFLRTGATTGKNYLVKDPPEAVFASYLIRIRPGSRILPEFLWWYFQSGDYWDAVFSGTEDGNRPNMNGSKLAVLEVPFPKNKTEQRSIVARLDALRGKLDELQRLQREVAAELASFTPALLAKAFRGEL